MFRGGMTQCFISELLYPPVFRIVALSCCTGDRTRNMCQKMRDWY